MISDKADNRNIISLEDLQEESQESKETKDRESEEEKKSPYLSDEEIKEYLERYRGRIPSVILRDIYEMVKGRRITERHLDRIVERVESMLNAEDQFRKIDDIYKKLEGLEKLLRQDFRSGEIAEKAETGERVEAEPEFEVKSAEVKPEKVKPVEGGVPVQERFEPHEHHAHVAYAERPYPKYPARRDRGYRAEIEHGDYGYDRYDFYGEPRLSRIPGDAKSIMLLLKWIEFLMERVGYDGLEDVLNYYVDINWISEDVLMAILRYARGIKLYHENSDWRPVGYMNVQDHLMSLLYIEALRTGRFDRNLIMEVEKDLYRMKKEIAELHGV